MTDPTDTQTAPTPSPTPTLLQEIEADLKAVIAKLEKVEHTVVADVKADLEAAATKIKGVL